MPRPGPKTAQATQLTCLEAGAQLAEAGPNGDPFQGLTMAAVAKLAGVPRNTLLYHWRDREAFTNALAAYMLGSERYAPQWSDIDDEASRLGERAPLEAITHMAAADLTGVLSDNVCRTMDVLALTYGGIDPKITEHARAGWNAVDADTWLHVYAPAAARTGRIPRAPFAAESLGMVFQTFIDGANLRSLIDPGALSDPARLAGGQEGAYQLAIAAMLIIFTRPGDGTDMRTVQEVLDSLLAPQSKGTRR